MPREGGTRPISQEVERMVEARQYKRLLAVLKQAHLLQYHSFHANVTQWNALQDFVREILREQPENIYNFGARYFSELANPVCHLYTLSHRFVIIGIMKS